MAVERTGKASFVYSYVQTRLRGQYNGKWPFSLLYMLKPLITAIRAIRRELKQVRRLRLRRKLINDNGDYFAIIPSCSHSILLIKYAANWLVWATHKWILKTKDFLLCLNLNFGNFTGRLRPRKALHVPHVKQDYFTPFNQSDHCFLALSLPSTLLKLPNNLHEGQCFLRQNSMTFF